MSAEIIPFPKSSKFYRDAFSRGFDAALNLSFCKSNHDIRQMIYLMFNRGDITLSEAEDVLRFYLPDGSL